MTLLRRRDFLRLGANAGVAVGLRAAITGLPVSFLLRGDVHAQQPNHPSRIAILASSSQGEPINVCGPGTYTEAYAAHFTHPQPGAVDESEIVTQTINGVPIGVESLSQSAEMALGVERVRMAKCFEALLPEMLEHLVWFNYRSGANIHPQFTDVLTCFGQVRGTDGRGAEQLPAAIAQETAALLGTTTSQPLILGSGTFVSNGSSLANYSPTKLKTLVNQVGGAMGGADNFAVMFDTFIDENYREVRRTGTRQQLRFFDQYASSRREASDFGNALGQLLEDITDDSIQSQMRCAAMVAKLNLAPVIMVNTNFGGDNHQDSGLLNETNSTLAMIAALDAYWKAIHNFGIVDDVVFANLDVFGRDPRSDGNGRSHYGDFVSGIMVSNHLQGGVVGGWALNDKIQATGINSSSGSPIDADINADETLQAYFKTIMNATGIPSTRQDLRLPTGIAVTSVTG